MSSQYISKHYTDENCVRIIAAQVVFFATVSLMIHSEILVLLLGIDFALRSFTYQPTPMILIAKFLSRTLKLSPKPIFSAPKKFAAGIGFGFSLMILLLFIFQFEFAAYIVGSILIFCALLESVFKICLGCYAHSIIVSPILNRIDQKK